MEWLALVAWRDGDLGKAASECGWGLDMVGKWGAAGGKRRIGVGHLCAAPAGEAIGAEAGLQIIA